MTPENTPSTIERLKRLLFRSKAESMRVRRGYRTSVDGLQAELDQLQIDYRTLGEAHVRLGGVHSREVEKNRLLVIAASDRSRPFQASEGDPSAHDELLHIATAQVREANLKYRQAEQKLTAMTAERDALLLRVDRIGSRGARVARTPKTRSTGAPSCATDPTDTAAPNGTSGSLLNHYLFAVYGAYDGVICSVPTLDRDHGVDLAQALFRQTFEAESEVVTCVSTCSRAGVWMPGSPEFIEAFIKSMGTCLRSTVGDKGTAL